MAKAKAGVAGPMLTTEQLLAVGDPQSFRFVSPSGELIWGAQRGMQSDLFAFMQPGPTECDEFLMGGLRGPGKTDALIAALAFPVNNPRYRGLLLRLEAEALKETIDRATYLYKQMGAVVKNRPPEFWFPSGAKIYTGHLRDERSFNAYKGHEYHFVGIEEISQVGKRELYLKLLGSNRSTVPGLKPKVILTSNPDGPGNKWLKDRFINVFNGGKRIPPKTPFMDPMEKRVRVFIPGRRDENLVLLMNDPNYYDRFSSLPEHLRRAWVEGDWDAPASQFFQEFRQHGPLLTEQGMEPDTACHAIPARPLPAWCHRWISLDWGYSHHSAAYWGCRAPSGQVHVYREYVVRKVGSDVLGAEIAKRSVRELEELPEHHMTLYLSHDAFSQRDRGKTIAEQIQRGIESILGPGSAFVLTPTEEERELKKTDPDAAFESIMRRRQELGNRVSITVRRCNPDRPSGWSYMRTMFRWQALQDPVTPDMDYAMELLNGPFGYMKYHAYMDLYRKQQPEVLPGVVIHKEACPILLDTIPRLVIDADKPGDVLKFEGDDDTVGDDPADGFRFLLMGYQDYESKVPMGAWVEQELERLVPAGCDDINVRIQIGQAAQERYQKKYAPKAAVVLGRAATALRSGQVKQ